MKPRNLPPLNAIRAFEAAARLGGFIPASEELCVTPGAVSQQVKRLEQWYGEALFERHVRGVSLTATGAQLQPKLSRILDELNDLLVPSKPNRRTRRLIISALPAFADRWLLPRLKDFQQSNPKIEIEVRADDQLPAFTKNDPIVAVRFLKEPLLDLWCERIFGEEIFPVCTPELAQTVSRDNLRQQSLLYDVAWKNDWIHWWQKAKLAGNPPEGTRFSLYAMAVRSALDGAGILMGHGRLLERELDSGTLVKPIPTTLPLQDSYFLVCAKEDREDPEIQTFRNWLMEKAVVKGEGAARP